MTTVVEALNRIARQCSVKAPSAWLGATRAEHLEIRDDFLLETVEDILDRVDLGEPIAKTTAITGPGTVNADESGNYALPSNFRRMLRDDFALYDNLQDRVGVPVSRSGEWAYLTDLGTAGITRFYRQKGYEGNFSLDIYRNLDTGETIDVHYISENWLINAGTEKSEFTDNADTLMLPRKLVETGTVARFRRRRGMEYGGVVAEYEALLERASNDSRNRRTIQFGEPDMSVKWQDLVPAFIPSS